MEMNEINKLNETLFNLREHLGKAINELVSEHSEIDLSDETGSMCGKLEIYDWNTRTRSSVKKVFVENGTAYYSTESSKGIRIVDIFYTDDMIVLYRHICKYDKFTKSETVWLAMDSYRETLSIFKYKADAMDEVERVCDGSYWDGELYYNTQGGIEGQVELCAVQ